MTGQGEPDLRPGEVYRFPRAHVYGAQRALWIRVDGVGGHPRGDWTPVRGAVHLGDLVVADINVLVRTRAIPAIVAGRAREAWPLPPVPVRGLLLARRRTAEGQPNSNRLAYGA